MNLPVKSNLKWQELILSFETLEFKSLAFQMMIIRARERFNKNEIDMDSAISLLYDFCKQNISGSNLQHDLKAYFKENEVIVDFDIKSKEPEIPKNINTEINKSEIENSIPIEIEESINDEVIAENHDQLESDSVTNIDNEREKLIHQLETLKNKVDEVQKTGSQKNIKKGFFKNIFK